MRLANCALTAVRSRLSRTLTAKLKWKLLEARVEFQTLSRLIKIHSASGRNRPANLSVFGHADPTGNDDYNKALSGRRAAAIRTMTGSLNRNERGSSEFNPILLLSRADQKKFLRQKDISDRDAANAPNRRVGVPTSRR